MGVLTVKLPADVEAKLDALTKRRGATRSALVREAIEKLVDGDAAAGEGGAVALAGDLAGAFEGPKDLASNKKWMRGYGR